MAFHHRKLFDDSLEDSLEKLCKPYCYPVNNTDADGSCPLPCIPRCFPTCNRPPVDELSPPPPPDYAFLSDNTNHPSKPFGLSVFLSISLAVLATIFFIFSCYTVYKFYKARYNSRSRQLSSQPPSQRQEEEAHLDFLDEDHGPVVDHPIWYIRTVGLQPSVISAITICKYKRGDGLVEGTECSVCLSEFQDDETLRLLPKCNHAFHIPCIDTWLGSHTNCPNCRAGIVVSTPNFQSPAQSLQSSGLNSGRLEEPQVGVSGIVSRESERERESEVLEVNIDVEDEEQSRVVSENQMEDLMGSSGGSREGEGIQPMRRSVSMDSLSALAVSTAIANAFSIQSERNKDKNFTEMNGLNSGIARNGAGNDDQRGSSSMERSLQKETSIVKRSLSCSAKVFLSRYSKSRNSVLPP